MIMNDEVEGIWNGIIVAYSDILSQLLHGRIEKNHKNLI
jgi:hypothetical protein